MWRALFVSAIVLSSGARGLVCGPGECKLAAWDCAVEQDNGGVCEEKSGQWVTKARKYDDLVALCHARFGATFEPATPSDDAMLTRMTAMCSGAANSVLGVRRDGCNGAWRDQTLADTALSTVPSSAFKWRHSEPNGGCGKPQLCVQLFQKRWVDVFCDETWKQVDCQICATRAVPADFPKYTKVATVQYSASETLRFESRFSLPDMQDVNEILLVGVDGGISCTGGDKRSFFGCWGFNNLYTGLLVNDDEFADALDIPSEAAGKRGPYSRGDMPVYPLSPFWKVPVQSGRIGIGRRNIGRLANVLQIGGRIKDISSGSEVWGLGSDDTIYQHVRNRRLTTPYWRAIAEWAHRISCGSDGTVLAIRKSDRKLIQYDASTDSFKEFATQPQLGPDTIVKEIKVQTSSMIYVVGGRADTTTGGLVWHFTDNRWEQVTDLPSTDIQTFSVGIDGFAGLTTSAGLIFWKPTNGAWEQARSGSFLSRVDVYNADSFVGINEHGHSYKFNPSTKNWEGDLLGSTDRYGFVSVGLRGVWGSRLDLEVRYRTYRELALVEVESLANVNDNDNAGTATVDVYVPTAGLRYPTLYESQAAQYPVAERTTTLAVTPQPTPQPTPAPTTTTTMKQNTLPPEMSVMETTTLAVGEMVSNGNDNGNGTTTVSRMATELSTTGDRNDLGEMSSVNSGDAGLSPLTIGLIAAGALCYCCCILLLVLCFVRRNSNDDADEVIAPADVTIGADDDPPLLGNDDFQDASSFRNSKRLSGNIARANIYGTASEMNEFGGNGDSNVTPLSASAPTASGGVYAAFNQSQTSQIVYELAPADDESTPVVYGTLSDQQQLPQQNEPIVYGTLQ